MFCIYVACSWWHIRRISLYFAETMHNCIWFHCGRQFGVIVEHIAQVADICINIYTMSLHFRIRVDMFMDVNIYFTHQVH